MSDPRQALRELRRHDRSHSMNCTFTPCDCSRHDELTATIATALDQRLRNAATDQLREIIVQFGDHLDGCPGRVGDDCTCGYLEALRRAPRPWKPPAASRLFVVIGGWMDYGERNDEIVGVFDDVVVADGLAADTSRYDMTRIVSLNLNAIRTEEER